MSINREQRRRKRRALLELPVVALREAGRLNPPPNARGREAGPLNAAPDARGWEAEPECVGVGPDGLAYGVWRQFHIGSIRDGIPADHG